MRTLGRHLISEHFGCDAGTLDDVMRIEAMMLEAARTIGATVMSSAFHRYAPHGVSGTLLIAESHLSIHTWPEHRYAAIDIFTCGGLDPRPGFACLAAALGAASSRMQEIVRGLPEHVAEGAALLPEDVLLLARHSPR
ncbi:MAG: adenosylmethionine decarboxylase [Deltaproteobacteria bacterium]|nr:adenosylmethionine decarboxylase [Deltaproteobacteria bacterium]